MNSDRRDDRMSDEMKWMPPESSRVVRAKRGSDWMERQRIETVLDQIEESVEEIYDQLAGIERALDELGNPAKDITQRAKHYWLAHIDGALLNRGGWLGGSFVSCYNTLEELRGLVEGENEDDS